MTYLEARHTLALTAACLAARTLAAPPPAHLPCPDGWTCAAFTAVWAAPAGRPLLCGPALVLGTRGGRHLWITGARVPPEARHLACPEN